jgi:hypothetical protein
VDDRRRHGYSIQSVAAKAVGDRWAWVRCMMKAPGGISIACHSDNSSQAGGLILFRHRPISPRVRCTPIRTDGGRDVWPGS